MILWKNPRLHHTKHQHQSQNRRQPKSDSPSSKISPNRPLDTVLRPIIHLHLDLLGGTLILLHLLLDILKDIVGFVVDVGFVGLGIARWLRSPTNLTTLRSNGRSLGTIFWSSSRTLSTSGSRSSRSTTSCFALILYLLDSVGDGFGSTFYDSIVKNPLPFCLN